jgi:hypothetical protein
MNQGKKRPKSRNGRGHLRPRRTMNVKPNGASFGRQVGALRGASIPTGRLATTGRPVHQLSNGDRRIIKSQIHGDGIAYRACPDCGRPLEPDHFHAEPAKRPAEVARLIEAARVAMDDHSLSNDEILGVVKGAIFDYVQGDTERTFVRFFKSGSPVVPQTLATMDEILEGIETFRRRVALFKAALDRYIERDTSRPLGRREAKRVLVGFAIDLGYSDSEIQQRLGVSRDLARDVRGKLVS